MTKDQAAIDAARIIIREYPADHVFKTLAEAYLAARGIKFIKVWRVEWWDNRVHKLCSVIHVSYHDAKQEQIFLTDHEWCQCVEVVGPYDMKVPA